MQGVPAGVRGERRPVRPGGHRRRGRDGGGAADRVPRPLRGGSRGPHPGGQLSTAQGGAAPGVQCDPPPHAGGLRLPTRPRRVQGVLGRAQGPHPHRRGRSRTRYPPPHLLQTCSAYHVGRAGPAARFVVLRLYPHSPPAPRRTPPCMRLTPASGLVASGPRRCTVSGCSFRSSRRSHPMHPLPLSQRVARLCTCILHAYYFVCMGVRHVVGVTLGVAYAPPGSFRCGPRLPRSLAVVHSAVTAHPARSAPLSAPSLNEPCPSSLQHACARCLPAGTPCVDKLLPCSTRSQMCSARRGPVMCFASVTSFAGSRP